MSETPTETTKIIHSEDARISAIEQFCLDPDAKGDEDWAKFEKMMLADLDEAPEAVL